MYLPYFSHLFIHVILTEQSNDKSMITKIMINGILSHSNFQHPFPLKHHPKVYQGMNISNVPFVETDGTKKGIF